MLWHQWHLDIMRLEIRWCHLFGFIPVYVFVEIFDCNVHKSGSKVVIARKALSPNDTVKLMCKLFITDNLYSTTFSFARTTDLDSGILAVPSEPNIGVVLNIELGYIVITAFANQILSLPSEISILGGNDEIAEILSTFNHDLVHTLSPP